MTEHTATQNTSLDNLIQLLLNEVSATIRESKSGKQSRRKPLGGHPRKNCGANASSTPLLSVGMRQYAGLPSDSDDLGEAGIIVFEGTAPSPN